MIFEENKMILKDKYWYNIGPKNRYDRSTKMFDSEFGITGKWLYYVPIEQMEYLIEQINNLADEDQLRYVKITRKDKGHDRLPIEPCKICIFTSDDENEKAFVKKLLKDRLKIDVTIWKSDKQTEADWNKDGWLAIGSELVKLLEKSKKGLSQQEVNRIKNLTKKLDIIRNKNEYDGQIEEMEKANFWRIQLEIDKLLPEIVSAISVKTKVNVFLSYSHKDKFYINRIYIHLKPILDKHKNIHLFYDKTGLDVGCNIDEKIKSAVSKTDIAILALSADYFASDYIQKNEYKPFIQQSKKGQTKIFSLIISPCRFARETELRGILAINDPNTPIIDMKKGKREEVFNKVGKLIEKYTIEPFPKA